MKGGTLKIRTKIAGALLALGLAGGGLALSATEASASYVFPGLSVIDTQASGGAISCDAYGTTGDGDVDCYTWIRVGGTLRRGSAFDYYNEASHGYVLVVCSQAWRGFTLGSWGPPWGDFWAQPQSPVRYYWQMISSHPYCVSPVLGPGYNYSGYQWPAVANANAQ
jgi:hypothetical protein